MTCLIEFTYECENREVVFRQLTEGGLSGMSVKVEGAWIAAQTGSAYIIVDAQSSAELYQACSRWADCGKLKITPIVAISEI